MKKIFLNTLFLMSSSAGLMAQTAASLPEFPLPYGTGTVVQPDNAGSSTLQDITYMGATNELYVHSWDGPVMNGIAWRRTDASGTTLNQGEMPIPFARDIDVALFQGIANDYYILAGFYFNNGSAATAGHYYSVYRIDPGGLTPLGPMTLLTSSTAFGRINVDANIRTHSLAITWHTPGIGIYVKASNIGISGLYAFGPNVLLPGTSAFQAPDICINGYTGGSGLTISLDVAYLSAAETNILVKKVDFYNVLGGTSTGISTEYTTTTASPYKYDVPRIDCPDVFDAEKWTTVFSRYSYVGTTVTEEIRAAVKDATWLATPVAILVRSASYTNAAAIQLNKPIVAYDKSTTRIQVGWITKNTTIVLPNITDTKYVGQLISDPGTAAPSSAAGSYMMVSNIPGGTYPVMAFSNESTSSDITGLHAAYARTPSDGIFYKDKPWSATTFKESGAMIQSAAEPSVYPSPFSTSLSITLPLKGHYDISITGIDGKTVYASNGDYENMQHIAIPTAAFIPGIYLIRINSPENNIDFIRKIMK